MGGKVFIARAAARQFLLLFVGFWLFKLRLIVKVAITPKQEKFCNVSLHYGTLSGSWL